MMNHYYLNAYAIPPLLVAILALVLGIFIQRLEKTSSFNRSILYVYLGFVVWLVGCAMLQNSLLDSVAFFWAHVLYMGMALTCATMFHLSVTLTGQWNPQRYFVYFFYMLAAGMAYLTHHPRFFESEMGEYFFGFYPKAGEYQMGLIVLAMLSLLMSLLNIVKQQLQTQDRSERRKMRFFIVAFIAMGVSFVDILSGYDLQIFPVGYAGIMTFVVAITCYKIRLFFLFSDRRAKELESEVAAKTQEISKIVEELRTTQLKLLETGKVSALASLSAGILHQISQPITAIHGFVKFIKKEMPADQPFYKPICLMEEQSVYLKEMLEDLMELIRHREIKKDNIDVNSCVQRAVNLLTDELRIRRVDWDLILTEDLPTVHADAVHLQQVFMNIIINAIQAMSDLPRGSRRYLKITSEYSRQKNQVVVSLTDSGPGLTPELSAQIFEPFFSTKTTGSGIGLALCKDLIAEHGGTIEVESAPGQGAMFVIRLPCSDSKNVVNLGVQTPAK